ncbi:MAG: hypothetical protein ACXAEU_11695 [Candidatus Hodarchaeales archaeon]|jgi:hypothetical protein
MGKIDKQVEEMHSMMKKMQDDIAQLSFNMIQLMQGGAVSSGSSSGSSRRKEVMSAEPATVDIDLKPLEGKLDELMERAANNDALIEIRDEMKRLTGGKVEKAEEMINNVSNLLEKGLQLTELGTVLDEIRDKLEELIVELSSQVTQV